MKIKQQLRHTKTFRVGGLLLVVLLFLMVGCLIFPPVCVNKAKAEAGTAITNPTITIDTSGLVELDLMPISSGGTFAASAETNFKVSTTNTGGYTLKIKSGQSGTDLKDASSNVLTSIDSAVTAAEFGAGSNYNNKWGYLPSKFNSAVNTNYLPAPSMAGDILDVTDAATTGEGTEYSLILGAKANYATRPGVYSNTFVLQAVANFTANFAVNYDANGLSFANGSVNTVTYSTTSATANAGTALYSHTSNIDDAGVQESRYGNQASFKDVVTVTGASRLVANLNYGLESGDTLYVLDGEYNGEISDVAGSEDIIGTYTGGEGGNGGNYTSATVNVTSSDTVTFVFVSGDGSAGTGNYGYYAVVSGYDNGDVLVQTSQTVYNRTVADGLYATPTVGNGQVFYGWSTSPDGFAEYASDTAVTTNSELAGGDGDVLTLYAIYGACAAGSICYNANGATTNTMANETINTSGDTTLWPSDFARSGYGFAGWNTKADGTGRNYGPMETVAINSINGVTLYANWVVEAGDMQNWTGCDSMSAGGVTALKDLRDNNVYTVAKLADGDCWMAENLRLDATATVGSSNISLAQGYGAGFVGLADSETADFTNSTVSNSLYGITGSEAANIINVVNEETDHSGYYFPRYNNSNTASAVVSMSDLNANIYGYGNYYTWTAAMANVNYYANAVASEAANTSLCPAGWELPSGGGVGKDFDMLNNAVNFGSAVTSARLRSYPNNFIYAGKYTNASNGDRGVAGYYWSSSASSGDAANDFVIGNNMVDIADDTIKPNGYAVRCVMLSGN